MLKLARKQATNKQNSHSATLCRSGGKKPEQSRIYTERKVFLELMVTFYEDNALKKINYHFSTGSLE